MLPEPEVKSTTASLVPVSNVICGVPLTVTDSLNTTWTPIVSPIPYVASAFDAVTLLTVGRFASTITAPKSPLTAPAVFPATSWIVPL